MTTEELIQKVTELNKDGEKDKHKYQQVIDLLTHEVLQKENSDVLYTEKSQAYSRLNKDEESKKESELALQINPDNAKALNQLGKYYGKQKEYEKAEENFKKAIEKDPYFSIPNYNLGLVYYNQKEYEKAEDNYKKAIEKDSKFDAAYYNLGKLYYIDLEQKQYQKAKENFEIFIILTKDNPDDFTERAKSFVKEIDDLLKSLELRNIVKTKNKIKEILKFNDREISHFTSLSTVNFLVNNSSPFRLSEATFLNDSSEGKTLFDFLGYNIESDNTRHEYTFAKKPFIGSFVHASKHNDLALWRLYGKEAGEEGKGCSITLDSAAFLQAIKDKATEATRQNFDKEFQLYKVAYWDDKDEFIVDNEKNTHLKDSMQELKTKVKDFKEKIFSKGEEDIKAYESLNVQEALNEIAYLFKNKEYQYEKEVRLVIKDPFGYEKHLEFDPSKMVTKVYINLCPIQKCISAISIGPKTPSKDDWAAYFHYYFDQLSASEKMEKVKVIVSTLPYK